MKPAQSVHIADSTLATGASGLLSAIEALLPVRFSNGREGASSSVAQIASAVTHVADESRSGRLPTLQLPFAGCQAGDPVVQRPRVRFADDPSVPWPFRGRAVDARVEVDVGAQARMLAQGGRILATDQDGRPIWTVNERPGSRTYRTSLRLPNVPLGADVGATAIGEKLIQILPVFQFLRELTEGQRLSNPRLRASFIIDDPNLHWPNYGFADYRDIAKSARQDRYHVAFATIPLDAWWVHRGTAEIFRTHTDSLSLLVHGNNHAKQELAQDFSPQACGALLQQADARIRLLEAKSGLQVCRVMVPPHGACSSRMLAQLPHHGFESACISAGSLRAHNTGQAWTRSLGLGPSELVEGCPVLPRWALSGTTDITLLTAAYLGQPLILRGHHQDLKNGLDVLRGFAKAINALGDVRWGSLSELSRLNFRHRLDGASMHIQPLGTRIDVAVPEGVDELRIDPCGFEWQSVRPEASSGYLDGGELVVPLESRGTYSFARRTVDSAGNPLTHTNPIALKLVLRRVLTEARDRLRVF
jgi:hypothetical protein